MPCTPPAQQPPSQRTTLRRKPARGDYDKGALHAVLDVAPVCHIAFNEGGSVHSLPMLGWRLGDDWYIHAARNSRIATALLAGECSVSVAVLDGLVLARSAFRHSMNYRSAVIYGRFVPVDDPVAQHTAYAALIDGLVPGRSAWVRPPSPAELSGTCLLRLPLQEAAVKRRSGGPLDSPDDLSWPVWAGVVPLAVQAGALQPEPESAAYPPPEPAGCFRQLS